MSFFGVAFVILLFLKLLAIAPVATWSWWWVTSPLWGGVLLSIALGVIGGLLALLFGRN